MSSDKVDYEIDGEVGRLTLNRPDRFNAIDPGLAEGLTDALDALGGDDDVRVVVLAGAGSSFCAGGDLGYIRQTSEETAESAIYGLAGQFHEAIHRVRDLSKAVVAKVDGPAAGGGFSLALACDLRIMSTEAYMQVGYTGAGLSMDGGGSFFLPRIVGLGCAMELVGRNQRIDAERAEEIGLANAVADGDSIDELVEEWVADLVEKPTGAIGRMKRLFNRSFDRSLERQLEEERRSIAEAVNSPEGREGIAAFLEKREADFRNLEQ